MNATKPGVNKIPKILLWLLPVLIIAGAVAFKVSVDNRKIVKKEFPPVPVRIVKAEKGDLTRTLKLNAHVESESMVTVLPLVAGILQEMFVEVGQKVSKDQTIARIDSARFQLQVQQAEAAYYAAKSSFDRISQLYNAGATTQQNYDQTKGQYDAYASQYELARIQLNYANVKSPIDGVVLVKHLDTGSIAAPERPLVTIGDLNDLIVRAKIPEKYYKTIQLLQKTLPISVTDAGGSKYKGIIKSISPFVSAETKNFELVISIQGGNQTLRPGMFVAIEFELERWKSVYSLPFQALSSGNTLWYVLDNVAKTMPFIPRDSSDEAFIIPAEYEPYQFIVEGQFFLREDMPVSIVGNGAQQ